MRNKQYLVITISLLLFISLLLVIGESKANPLAYQPLHARQLPSIEQNPPGQGAAGVLLAALAFWNSYLSPIDGERCPLYPSCATYARQAIHKHGGLLGGWMTIDRLLHERSEISSGELITSTKKKSYVVDRLSMNDFWLLNR